jgi:hypothetical protein
LCPKYRSERTRSFPTSQYGFVSWSGTAEALESAALSIDGLSFLFLENRSLASTVKQNVAAKRRKRSTGFENIVVD